MKRSMIFGLITLISLVSLNSADADPVQPATTIVAKWVEGHAGGYYYLDANGPAGQQPQPYEQAISSAFPFGSGSAFAGFGPGVPQIGITRVQAQTNAESILDESLFSATVQYFFEIHPIGTGPSAPSIIPIQFSASGYGYAASATGSAPGASSLARVVGIADLYGAPLYTYEAAFRFDSGLLENNTFESSFNGTKNLSLYPNYCYGVVMSTACEAHGFSASCLAEIDPTLGFDQMTFDALMGADTFALNERYQFVFSENLPTGVPEPSAIFLLAIGLIGLGGFRKRLNG
jgi:hypothetical protein